MNDHLLIPLAEVDAARVVEVWSWLAPPRARLVALSAFAEPFVEDARGAVHLIDTVEGTLQAAAQDRASFERSLAAPNERLRELLWADTVEVMRDVRGVTRPAGRCFGWKVSPLLGAPLTSDNIDLYDLAVHPSTVSLVLRAMKGIA